VYFVLSHFSVIILSELLPFFPLAGMTGFIILTGAFRVRFVVFSNFLPTDLGERYEIFGFSILPFTLTGMETRVPPKSPFIIGVFFYDKIYGLKR